MRLSLSHLFDVARLVGPRGAERLRAAPPGALKLRFQDRRRCQSLRRALISLNTVANWSLLIPASWLLDSSAMRERSRARPRSTGSAPVGHLQQLPPPEQMPYYAQDERAVSYSYEHPPPRAHVPSTFEPALELWPSFFPSSLDQHHQQNTYHPCYPHTRPTRPPSPPSQTFAQLAVGPSTSRHLSHGAVHINPSPAVNFGGLYQGTPTSSTSGRPSTADFDWDGGWERDASREDLPRSLASPQDAVEDGTFDTVAVQVTRRPLPVRRRNHRCPNCDKAFTRFVRSSGSATSDARL